MPRIVSIVLLLQILFSLNASGRKVSGGEDTSSIYSALHLPYGELKTKTGIYTLEIGGKSLAARLWLLAHAKRSIEMQYFSFSRNITGLLVCEEIVRAAERGVKVRLLVDEVSSRMNGYEIKALNAHDNIEIRVYNAGLKLGRADKRLKKLAKNSNRLMRRMHNKTFVIDGQVAITGGRNVSDEYFDFDDKYNFRDRDILLAGKETKAVEKSFNDFWDDKLTVKVEELSGKGKQTFDVRVLFEKFNKIANDTVKYAADLRELERNFPTEINEARKAETFLIVEQVTFVSDIPGKNEDRPERKGGITTDTIIALMRSAKRTLDIHSPYFITTEEGKQLLKETVARGVRVRILTNSMVSIDNLEAFAAYQKDRKEHLATGIELYEFRPDPAVRFKLMIPTVQARIHYKAVCGLHSKSMIIDGHTSVIGSYNLDPRSANYNTECFAIVRSTEEAKNLSVYFEEEFSPANSWLITSDYNPDSEASYIRRFKNFLKKIYPKKLL